ncbi:hypothetical protein HZB60_11055 [candidate division KSB1 bacterium]|nr:hypothetical protein [candidate division KSB1 bacterium]
MRWAIVVSALALIAWSCAPQEDETEPGNPNGPVLTISVEAQPWSVPADGESQIVIFVECFEAGHPVADSTEIVLLNTIGTLQSGTLLTQGGIALDTLTADSAAALGMVIAYTQGVRDTVEIMFTEP